jgi:hypothetical protein
MAVCGGLALIPPSPYSVRKFLILMDLANRGGAKLLKALELSAESSQERTYSACLGVRSVPPFLSPPR